MEHAYERLMQEHNLSLEELPNDAKIGIESIQLILKAVKLNDRKGSPTKPATYDKIKANDKWVVREILDYVENKNTNKSPLPHKAADVIKDDVTPNADDAAKLAAEAASAKAKTEADEKARIEKEAADKAKAGTSTDGGTNNPDDKKKSEEEIKAGKIDKELEVLYNAGKTKLTLDELKSSAKTAYDVTFDTYSAEGPNGVETTYYDLTETEKEIFTLTKK